MRKLRVWTHMAAFLHTVSQLSWSWVDKLHVLLTNNYLGALAGILITYDDALHSSEHEGLGAVAAIWHVTASYVYRTS